MGMLSLVCPQCGANITLNDTHEFGFCSYCGAKMMLKDVVELHGKVEVAGINSKEQLLKNGLTFLKLQNYDKAEKVFQQVIDNYPDCTDGYSRMLDAITHNYSIYQKKSEQYAKSMISICSEEEKEKYTYKLELYKKYLEQWQMKNNVADLYNEKNSLEKQIDDASFNAKGFGIVGIIFPILSLMFGNTFIIVCGVIIAVFCIPIGISYANLKPKLETQKSNITYQIGELSEKIDKLSPSVKELQELSY